MNNIRSASLNSLRSYQKLGSNIRRDLDDRRFVTLPDSTMSNLANPLKPQLSGYLAMPIDQLLWQPKLWAVDPCRIL